jgi:ubiquitin-like domain-containing CTD phosphatase 1
VAAEEYDIVANRSPLSRVADLKDKLNSLTSVPPDRQKIIGLISRKLPPDDVTMYAAIFFPSFYASHPLRLRRKLGLTPGKKFTLIGTPVGMELQARSDDTPDVMNDFDVDVSQYPELMMSFANDQRNVRKVKEATDNLELHIMNEPREGKPLLVLDLDYSRRLPTC